MKVLLDKMLPVALARALRGHDTTTVQHAGFKGLKNGDLIRRAVAAGFQVLVTSDRNLLMQQAIADSGLAVVLVRGSRMSELGSQIERVSEAITEVLPGEVLLVERG